MACKTNKQKKKKFKNVKKNKNKLSTATTSKKKKSNGVNCTIINPEKKLQRTRFYDSIILCDFQELQMAIKMGTNNNNNNNGG